MNYPNWDVSAAGLLIAAVAVVHVFISHFAVGGGLFLIWYEWKARRDSDPQLLAYVRRHSRFFLLLTLVLGALTGVGIWFTIGLVHPQATSTLIQTFVWVWAIEWTFFATEIAAALVYYYGWDRLQPRAHLRVGWVYFVSAWMSLFVINGILTFMLTPGDWPLTRNLVDGFFNPTFWPSLVVRSLIAMGLAGLYAMVTAALNDDRALRHRVARSAALGWLVPCLVCLTPALAWYLANAEQAGIPTGEILGTPEGGLAWLLTLLRGSDLVAGYPPAVTAARLGIASSVILAALVALVAALPQMLRPRVIAPLMALGLVAFGSFEWIREDLRKPYVIGRLMFVNGVRLPPVTGAERVSPSDPFTIGTLNNRGLLESAKWLSLPAEFTGRDPQLVHGEAIFGLLCRSCHTLDGHLAIRPLVMGRAQAAISETLSQLARPVDSLGEPVGWDSPDLRIRSWRGRRMPPFAGTEEERQDLAAYLADLAGTRQPAGVESPGETLFNQKCVFCHGTEGPWPIEYVARGRDWQLLYENIQRLPELNPAMPPFEGSDDEREALARFLAERVR